MSSRILQRCVSALAVLAAGAAAIPEASAAIPGGTLDPATIPKYTQRLVVPPAMPTTATLDTGSGPIDYYEIAVRQLEQQILPPEDAGGGRLPTTRVWSYGSVNHPETFNYPAFTIEAAFTRPIRVKWINDLVDADGNFLPHLLPVDPTLHWANPPGGAGGRDTRPAFAATPGRYEGPVPLVPHLHGGHNAQESDGFAEAWFLPAARDLPEGHATEGTWYERFEGIFEEKFGVAWEPGTATFQYENVQRAATLWYHDHTLGMTRLNVYAGPAGFYLLRGGPGDVSGGILPGPAPSVDSDPHGRFYELPIAIQDRSFNEDGSLFYPDSRAFFEGSLGDGFEGPWIPDSDVPPVWNPEFFANTMVVNGRTWPTLEVEPRRYRLRLLNGCSSRFLILKLAYDSTPEDGSIDDGDYTTVPLPFWQLGSEGGFLPAPVNLDELVMGVAERADVVVDYGAIAASLPPGVDALYLVNEGPDEPFGGGAPGVDFAPAEAATTRQVMRFDLGALASDDPSVEPARLALPPFEPVGPETRTRKVSLNEETSAFDEFGGPVAATLGTVRLEEDGEVEGVSLRWHDDVTENPDVGSVEVWELYNFTPDAHPIHIHEVQFQVVGREVMDDPGATSISGSNEPLPWETGFKDTVVAYPGEITRVRALFDLPGLYVWHCHLIEHEDNEMMRPYCVGPCPAPP